VDSSSNAPNIEESTPDESRNDASLKPRKRRWLKWLVRGVALIILLPVLLIGGYLAYDRLTALPTPDTLEALFPSRTIAFLKVSDPETLLRDASQLEVFRHALGWDVQGKPIKELKRHPLHDDESWKEYTESVQQTRFAFGLMQRFVKGEMAAVMLDTDSPETAPWLMMIRLESALAESLVATARGLLVFSRTMKSEEYNGVVIDQFSEDDDPEGSIHLVRLGQVVVVGFGLPDAADLKELIDRYNGKVSPIAVPTDIKEYIYRDQAIGVAEGTLSPRDAITFDDNNAQGDATVDWLVWFDGDAFAKICEARIERYLGEGKADKAKTWMDWYAFLGPEQETFITQVRLKMYKEQRLAFIWDTQPHPERFAKILGSRSYSPEERAELLQQNPAGQLRYNGDDPLAMIFREPGMVAWMLHSSLSGHIKTRTGSIDESDEISKLRERLKIYRGEGETITEVGDFLSGEIVPEAGDGTLAIWFRVAMSPTNRAANSFWNNLPANLLSGDSSWHVVTRDSNMDVILVNMSDSEPGVVELLQVFHDDINSDQRDTIMKGAIAAAASSGKQGENSSSENPLIRDDLSFLFHVDMAQIRSESPDLLQFLLPDLENPEDVVGYERAEALLNDLDHARVKLTVDSDLRNILTIEFRGR
jgi:hypothetical protein